MGMYVCVCVCAVIGEKCESARLIGSLIRSLWTCRRGAKCVCGYLLVVHGEGRLLFNLFDAQLLVFSFLSVLTSL